MAAHWGLGWRDASWDSLWPPAPAVAAACAEKAGGSGTGCLVAMPTWCLCELGKLAGNTTAERARARPLGERAPPRVEGGAPRGRTGTRDTELGTRDPGSDAPQGGLGS